MNKDYVDSIQYIRKSQRDDYNNGVEREYDIYIEGNIVWAKFIPNMTYRVHLSDSRYTKYVLDFQKSLVYLVPSKKDKNDYENTFENVYISNLDGEVILDYNLTGEGKINVNDYLMVNVKCDSLVIKNCNTLENYNVFEGIIANNMKFIKCDINCFTKSSCIDGIRGLILEDSSIVCNVYSFLDFDKIILDGSSFIFEADREVNLYARNITLTDSMLGFKTSDSSRVAFKYLEAIDSKINSSYSGIIIYGVKKANLVNSVIGNIDYNNDITIKDVERDKISVIYNNVSERDSLSYTGFVERYRGEVRGLYLSGKISEFECNRIIDDLDDFLLNIK